MCQSRIISGHLFWIEVLELRSIPPQTKLGYCRAENVKPKHQLTRSFQRERRGEGRLLRGSPPLPLWVGLAALRGSRAALTTCPAVVAAAGGAGGEQASTALIFPARSARFSSPPQRESWQASSVIMRVTGAWYLTLSSERLLPSRPYLKLS